MNAARAIRESRPRAFAAAAQVHAHSVALVLVFAVALLGASAAANAQQAPRAPAAPPPTAQAQAPIDLTGYWTTLITNEWRWRMVTPKKGDYATLPINAAARQVADAWDPARDTASGEQCRAYGAALIMQLPVRLHVTWADEQTLQMDIDNGMQRRAFRFAGAAAAVPAEPSWQGTSRAAWEIARGRGREGAIPGTARPPNGALKVITTNLRPGYLRKNGVPYSADAIVTEYYDRFDGTGGPYLNVTVVVEDPRYLNQPYVRTMQFRREPSAAKWNPQPCSAD
jgi:hypothetical protein